MIDCVCRPAPGKALAPTPFKFKYSAFCHGVVCQISLISFIGEDSWLCVCGPAPCIALAPKPFNFKYRCRRTLHFVVMWFVKKIKLWIGDDNWLWVIKVQFFLFCGTGGNLFHFTFKHCCMSKIWKKYDFLPKSFVSATTPTILSFHSPYIDF